MVCANKLMVPITVIYSSMLKIQFWSMVPEYYHSTQLSLWHEIILLELAFANKLDAAILFYTIQVFSAHLALLQCYIWCVRSYIHCECHLLLILLNCCCIINCQLLQLLQFRPWFVTTAPILLVTALNTSGLSFLYHHIWLVL